MYNGYRRIFWGLFFSTFHITVNQIPLLPAFVGWLIVAGGVKQLCEASNYIMFGKAHASSLALACLSLIGQVMSFTANRNEIFKYNAILIQVITLIFVYFLMDGSVHKLYLIGKDEEAIGYILNLRIYMIIFIINTLWACYILTSGEDNRSVLVAVVAVFQVIWLMVSVSRLKAIYPENDGQEEGNDE